MTTLNPLFGQLATLQGIDVGSDQWKKGGIAAFSGQSGAHWSYGWLHDAYLTMFSPWWPRAVIANAAQHPCWYADEPLRSGTYHMGGRPIGWIPEDSADQPNGDRAYIGTQGVVLVSGPDVLHEHWGPLRSLARTRGLTTATPYGPMPTDAVAKAMLTEAMGCLGAQVRADSDYVWGDRGASCIAHELAGASVLGALRVEDQLTLWAWVKDTALPFFESAPGLHVNTKVDSLKVPPPNFQVYNGLFWLLPAFYDLAATTEGPIQARLNAVVARWAQWVLDLHAIWPEAGFNIKCFAATPAILEGTQGVPLPTLAGQLTSAQIDSGTSWDLWGYRAASVALAVLGGSQAQALVDMLKAKWLPGVSDPVIRAWMVDANGSYAA